jgi:hypothetical protein
MWEQKTGTVGTLNPTEVHDVNNHYTFNGGTPITDGGGTLYSDFLLQLNGLTTNGGGACFAGHCDWQIPTIGELRSIVSAPFPTCTSGPCIDPTFGPTQALAYWSSSALLSNPVEAYYIYFFNGNVNLTGKGGSLYARAVRGGR